METPVDLLAAVIGGYLLGCLPFAVITSKLFGLADPRSFGSGNPGATNVLRSGNKLAAALTLLGDAAKGWVAMLIAAKLSLGETAVALAGLAAFVGHVFPFTLSFKGGKGVATALGVMIGFDASFAGIVLLIWIATVAVFRYSSLGAIVAALVAPAVAWLVIGHSLIVSCIAIMSAILLVRHGTNIRNLLAGTESKVGRK